MHVSALIVLLSTFVKRWQLDTNSFDMLLDEMTITLHDVKLMLGIPAYGEAINTKLPQKQLMGIVNRDLGASLTDSRDNDSSHGIRESNISKAGDSSHLLMEIKTSFYILLIIENSLFLPRVG